MWAAWHRVGGRHHARGAARGHKVRVRDYTGERRELGRFNMGSTVILLFEPNRAAGSPGARGQCVQLGSHWHRLVSAGDRQVNSSCADGYLKRAQAPRRDAGAAREFFARRGVLEVETPILSAAA